MKLFLDSCVIIYWIEAKEPYYSSFLAKLAEINNDHSDAKLAVSRLSMLECFVLPLRENNKTTYKLYHDFFNQSDIEIIELSSEVIETATHLRAYNSLRTPDAIQAASAICLGESVKFITNDKAFKNIPDLSVINI